MESAKIDKIQKTYGVIGKVLCTIAGGIVGFVAGGAIIAIPGLVAGYLVGHLLEKRTLRVLNNTNT